MHTISLTREVRFGLHADPPPTAAANGYAGHPPLVGLAPFLTLRITARGPVDPRTGMLVNIKQIDTLVRDVAVPELRRYLLAADGAPRGTADVLPKLLTKISPGLPAEITALELALSPFLHLRVSKKDPTMVELSQRFEFSAAHRLHAAALSADENARTFGRCNNPHGHGHNYELEVTVAGTPDAATGSIMPVPLLQQIVTTTVLDVFDHKHLNIDCAEFKDLNPTVENIAQVIYAKLRPAIPAPAKLRHVRVWETPKTVAQYGE